MVALHRDEIFPTASKSVREHGRSRRSVGPGALPFNWRLVAALAVNVAVWGGAIAGVRALIH